MTLADRVGFYNDAHPKYPGLSINKAGTMVAGCWMIGAQYKNPNPLYGAYPRGYLQRVHSMFPDARQVLHVFSGGLTLGDAQQATGVGVLARVELVDLHGPEQGRHPTWRGDVLAMPEDWAGRFDLILADPPYSAADAEKYDVKMPDRKKVISALRRVARKGANLVWLDQVWPQHRKTEWRTWAQIGLIRSTCHRARVVSMFEAV